MYIIIISLVTIQFALWLSFFICIVCYHTNNEDDISYDETLPQYTIDTPPAYDIAHPPPNYCNCNRNCNHYIQVYLINS